LGNYVSTKNKHESSSGLFISGSPLLSLAQSYVGVQLVQALDLIRQAAIRAGNPVGPILAISYKNHALDEILLDVVQSAASFSSPSAGKKPTIRVTMPTLLCILRVRDRLLQEADVSE
jgi:hypothetical protein